MATDLVTISVSSQIAVLDTCDLCQRAASPLIASVTIQHAAGGVVQFSACQHCAQAVRRLAAASGGPARLVSAGPHGEARVPSRTASASAAGAVQLVHTFVQHASDNVGNEYLVSAHGQRRVDGTWAGFIAFEPIRGGLTRWTSRETTQSTLEDLAYWASGIEPTYLEGALARARPRQLQD